MKVVETGRNAILVCEAVGDPPPNVYWVKDTLRLDPDPRYSIVDQGQLKGKAESTNQPHHEHQKYFYTNFMPIT